MNLQVELQPPALIQVSAGVQDASSLKAMNGSILIQAMITFGTRPPPPFGLGCVQLDSFLVAAVLAAIDQEALEVLPVFPNPFVETCQVLLPEQALSFQVFNSQGQWMEQGPVPAGQVALQVGKNFSSGIFVLLLSGADQERWVCRLVKR